MATPYTQSGKLAGIVYQRNRYGQICYPAFVPFNPNTPAQVAVRLIFAAVSKRWRTLTQPQRDAWIAVARAKKSRPRLGCGPLTGFNFFVKINVNLANRGEAQVDLPPEHTRSSQPAVSSPFDPCTFDHPPIGPTHFLQTNQLLDASAGPPCKLAAPVPPPA